MYNVAIIAIIRIIVLVHIGQPAISKQLFGFNRLSKSSSSSLYLALSSAAFAQVVGGHCSQHHLYGVGHSFVGSQHLSKCSTSATIISFSSCAALSANSHWLFLVFLDIIFIIKG